MELLDNAENRPTDGEYSTLTCSNFSIGHNFIGQMKTSSAQTILSNFRRENEGQTYPPKDAGTNTDVEKGTNPVRLKCYVTGLRDSSAQSQVIRGEFE